MILVKMSVAVLLIMNLDSAEDGVVGIFFTQAVHPYSLVTVYGANRPVSSSGICIDDIALTFHHSIKT